MVLSDKQIKEFQEMYKKAFGKEISMQEAYEQAMRLLRLVDLIYKPMTEDEYASIIKRRRLLAKEDEDTKREIGF